MHRHQWVASQPTALRLVVKQAHGVAASAASEKPLHNVVEGTITPKGQPGGERPQGHRVPNRGDRL